MSMTMIFMTMIFTVIAIVINQNYDFIKNVHFDDDMTIFFAKLRKNSFTSF
jgi:hypothetical protein